jgi:hypothetical protein
VLAVWTDRCKASEVCRQLKINFMTSQHWQRRAIAGAGTPDFSRFRPFRPFHENYSFNEVSFDNAVAVDKVRGVKVSPRGGADVL